MANTKLKTAHILINNVFTKNTPFLLTFSILQYLLGLFFI